MRKNLQASHKDFTAAHQQVEWFLDDRHHPVTRLGEVLSLGPLPPFWKNQRLIWQSAPGALALVRPTDGEDSDGAGHPRVWLRISQGLEPFQSRLHQLDLAMVAAILLALVLSALSATLLAQRVVQPLERSLRRLREFELDASHELRGPLAAMAANAEMGLLDAEVESQQRRRFEAIASATEQMQQLVEDLLLLARQQEGSREVSQRVELDALVKGQMALYSDALALRDQTLEGQIEKGVEVLGQASMLQQLIRNLLDNALRHCPDGAQIQIRLWRRGRVACLAVLDDGPGIPQEQLGRVFDRFWRASPHRSTGGSGLGLAIAARVSHLHGGRVRVESAPGSGSVFLVELPLAPAC